MSDLKRNHRQVLEKIPHPLEHVNSKEKEKQRKQTSQKKTVSVYRYITINKKKLAAPSNATSKKLFISAIILSFLISKMAQITKPAL